MQPDTKDTRALQFLVEARRRIVDAKTRLKNRLTAVLKQYYPQILDWFADVDSAVAIDFLERWPTLENLQRVRRSTLDRFFKASLRWFSEAGTKMGANPVCSSSDETARCVEVLLVDGQMSGPPVARNEECSATLRPDD